MEGITARAFSTVPLVNCFLSRYHGFAYLNVYQRHVTLRVQ